MSIHEPMRPTPTHLPDSTLTGVIHGPLHHAGSYDLLSVRLPTGLLGDEDGQGGSVAGRYFLARCGAQSQWERAERWDIYWRRPLLAVDRRAGRDAGAGETVWQLAMPRTGGLMPADPGYRWLAQLGSGAPVNLMGPLGNSLTLAHTTKNLLILADGPRLALALPAIHAALDRGGQVTLLLDRPDPVDQVDKVDQVDQVSQDLPLSLLPLPVEVRVTQDPDEWQDALADLLRWADQLYSVVDPTRHASFYPDLARLIRQERFQLEPGFAQIWVDAPLVCGTGACLVCVVPTAGGGVTRACVHGPVFDLGRLTA